MEEILNRIEEDINSMANDGYSVDILKGDDISAMQGYIWSIADTESAFDNLDCMYNKDAVIGKAKHEHLEEVWESVYESLIASAVMLLYSLIDGNEVYHED